jgi:hypothetical protein
MVGMKFSSGKQLRAEMERRFGRRLTEADWATIDPGDWSTHDAPFTDAELEDLLAAAGAELQQPTLSKSEVARAQASARGSHIAAAARALVERERLTLFGETTPPFADVSAAAEWIEAQASSLETARLTITVELPSQELDLPMLHALRDWLDHGLASAAAGGWDFTEFMRQATGLRNIATNSNLLPYLPASAATADQAGVKRVAAQSGSRLGQLLEAAQHLVDETEWELVNAVHHILTGGLMTTPVHTSAQYRAPQGSPHQHSVELNVRNPEGVPADEVAQAYITARSQLPTRRTRARSVPRNERLAAFVLDHPKMAWKARFELWNREDPDLFVSVGAMTAAYRRTARR